MTDQTSRSAPESREIQEGSKVARVEACLCCICGTVSLARDWTYWQPNCDEATEEAMPWRPHVFGETDPMARCPRCRWEHSDIDDGSGVYEGTLAEMEAQRETDLAEMGEWWADGLSSEDATRPTPTSDSGPGCKNHRGDPHNLCEACWVLEPDATRPTGDKE